jgi:chromosome segregation ATPase
MTGEELHNFCKYLYSQVQSKDEEISRLTANIKELTDEVRQSRLQQQAYNDENMAANAAHSQKLDVVLQQLQETKQKLTDTERKLETAETLLADANEKNRQLEAERKKNAKERKDLENEIALLRSGLYSGSKSQQAGRSVEEVGANDGREDFDGSYRERL